MRAGKLFQAKGAKRESQEDRKRTDRHQEGPACDSIERIRSRRLVRSRQSSIGLIHQPQITDHRVQHAAHSPPLPSISETVEQELATLTSPSPTPWKLHEHH